ncbi:hypothetical protein PM082_004869 [Marasmius tenuissimus]|nr:hypothetical protein PM082_004869 [Marasmius tenuissimus]
MKDGSNNSTRLQLPRLYPGSHTQSLFVGQHARAYFPHLSSYSNSSLIKEEDRVEFVKLVKKVLEAAMCRRSALLTQIFAVAESDALTLIAHDELANGIEFAGRYWQKNWIVYYYLSYTRGIAIQSLRDNETITFPVANRYCLYRRNRIPSQWNFRQ